MATTSASGVDPTLYLYTSLTAGSSHIISATSRIETILKANKIPFRAIDCATDDKARMIWGRRSKGKKIPGLVKYGQVVGDLEQIEEWNEFGELKEQIESFDDPFGNTHPDPPISSSITRAKLPQSDAQESNSPSRASSETRHISISEPTNKESGGNGSSKSGETHMSATMRQLGAEAAAKASERKASATKSAGVAAVPTTPTKPDSTSKTPSPAVTKLAPETADPAEAPAELTDSKTPDQLASEGVRRASSEDDTGTETTEATAAPPSSSAPPSENLTTSTASTQEQLLAAQQRSSLTKRPSRLAESTPLAESHTVTADDDDHETIDDENKDTTTAPAEVESKFGEQEGAKTSTELGTATETAATRTSSAGASHSSEQLPKTRTHRGSSISEASKEEIRAAEEKNRIMEESEEDEQAIEESESKTTSTSATKTQAKDLQSSNKVEKEVTKGQNPQDAGAKDENAAGVSVGD